MTRTIGNAAVKTRQSNIELLRIISMLMVLAVHVDGASLELPEVRGDLGALTGRDVWQLLWESVTIIGVNCFVMISGYFGIKLRWKGVGNFLFECLFYSVGIATVALIAFPDRFSWSEWGESWMVLTHSDWWYVPAYFGLMLLSPVLNAGLDSLDRRTFAWVLGGFLAFNVWGGWVWALPFNATGYTIIQMILLYMMARFIRLYVDVERISRWMCVAGCVVSVICIFISSLWLSNWKGFGYNSPFVMSYALSFFLLFLTFRFTSPAVNYVARSAFAAYLIHKAPLVWGNVMKPLVVTLWQSLSLPMFTLAALGIITAFYLIAMVADPVRRFAAGKIFGGR